MSRNAWIIFIVICVLLLGGLIWMSRGNQVDVSTVEHNAVIAAGEDNGDIADHTMGNPDAKVRIIEYGDFQCPGCASASSELKDAVSRHKDDVVFIYRHFPIPGHPNARAAAAAAESANMQGAYWEMHDRLFANQNDWASLSGTTRTEMFKNYAVALGLDQEKFLTDLESETITKKINFDASLGRQAGVTGTPSIFVNGEKSDVYYSGDEVVNSSAEGANPAWSNADAFEKHVILPALKEAGVDVE